jgi:two-component system cell cycle sensor histidine kinase PleC
MTPTEPRPYTPLNPPSVSDTARAALEAWPNAAFVFDPQSACLIAANERGRAMFPALPATLDGAMPAVRTLRDLARAGGAPWAGVPLVFWTATGVEALACDVVVVEGSEPLLQVCAVAAEARPAPAASEPDRAPRSDAETLRDIADKIRAGQARFIAAAPSREGLAKRPARDFAGAGLGADDAALPGIDLAKLAHELKTPLSAIAAASEIMKEGRLGEIGNVKYAGYIADIHSSARHALDLIQRMLDQRGDVQPFRPQDFKFEAIVLDDLVESCLSTVRPLAADKGLTLALRRSQTPATVMADGTALRQIVLNLVTNAMKFTSAGGRITVAIVASRRGASALTVEDTGSGMTAAAVSEALRAVPVDVPRMREGGGLGLGLPMSRTLAEAMGATLSIDSGPGRGTRVTVAFPGGPLVAI